MKILAIDPASKCGWAHSDGPSGTWDLSVRRDESGGMRLVRFKSKIRELKHLAGVDIVVYEAARHAAPGMQGALVTQSEIQGVLKEWCESEKIHFRGYSPSEIKKFATGKGNSNKEAMKNAAKERGWNVKDDNEADARFLLEMAKRDFAAEIAA